MNLCICEFWNSTNQLQSNITLEHIEISMLSHKIVENWNSFKIIVIGRWLNGNKSAEWKNVQIFLYDTVFMYWRNIEKYTNFCMVCTFNVVQTHQESNNRGVDGSFGFGPFPWFHPQLTIDLTYLVEYLLWKSMSDWTQGVWRVLAVLRLLLTNCWGTLPVCWWSCGRRKEYQRGSRR